MLRAFGGLALVRLYLYLFGFRNYERLTASFHTNNLTSDNQNRNYWGILAIFIWGIKIARSIHDIIFFFFLLVFRFTLCS